MTSTNPATHAILTLLAEFQAEREVIERRFKEEIGAIDDKVHAVETTLQLLTKGQELSQPGPPKAAVTDILVCRTQKEALRKMAVISGGKVNAAEAAHLLIQARKTKASPRNATPNVYSIMRNSDEWEWVEPGTFRLVGLNGNQPIPSAQIVSFELDNA